jgi:hypothetical protein
VQQFRADSDIELCKVLIAALALMACSMQIALPNRTTFQLPAKRVSPNRLLTHRTVRTQGFPDFWVLGG